MVWLRNGPVLGYEFDLIIRVDSFLSIFWDKVKETSKNSHCFLYPGRKSLWGNPFRGHPSPFGRELKLHGSVCTAPCYCNWSRELNHWRCSKPHSPVPELFNFTAWKPSSLILSLHRRVRLYLPLFCNNIFMSIVLPDLCLNGKPGFAL